MGPATKRPRKLIAAFIVLDCTMCQFQAYALADEAGKWDGRCPRCRGDAWHFNSMRVARTREELQLIQLEATIANVPDEDLAGARRGA